MAQSAPGLGSGSSAMSYRALLYRRPSEPQAIEVVFDRSIYLVRVRRHRQARRYTLRIAAATREVILTIPPRGTLKEARAFAQKHGGWIAARLGRLPEAVPLRRRHRGSAARHAAPDRASPRRARHGLDRGGRSGERLLCVAGDAPHVDRRVGDFLRREAKRELEAASQHFAARTRRQHQAGRRARPGKPLGLLLDRGRAVLFVAAHPGAEPSCSIISPRTKWRTWSR